jgi:hypothetical protein
MGVHLETFCHLMMEQFLRDFVSPGPASRIKQLFEIYNYAISTNIPILSLKFT